MIGNKIVESKTKVTMEKSNKMYSVEVVKKAISATALSFTGRHEEFESMVKELPDELRKHVLAAVLASHMVIHEEMTKIVDKAKEVKDKLDEIKNPTIEDVNRIFDRAFKGIEEK